MQTKLWTISALAVELAHDRRTLASWLDDLAPDEDKPGPNGRTSRKWRLARVVKHIYTPTDSDGLDLNAERARLAKEMADKNALANAHARGELVSAATVAVEWGRLISACRSRLLSLPTKLAPRLAKEKSPTACLDLVTVEIHAALRELSEYRPSKD